MLWRHFLTSYSNPKIVLWSVWYACAMGGYLMILNYVQLLWQEIDVNRDNLYNAGVEAVLTLLGAIAAFLAGFLKSKTFKNYELWILTFCTFLEGVFIAISSQTSSIWVAYAMHILFSVLYSFMITIASASIAQLLAEDSFALIFGINTLFAYIFQTLLTVIVITVMKLETRIQFLAYGFYFMALSLMYLMIPLAECRRRNKTLRCL